ncbi:MAG TPA: thioredoxin family protein [Pyrinomonadaceae bacterium]
MTKLRLWVMTLVVLLGLTVFVTPAAAQNQRWLHGSSGYAKALELQREMKIPLVVYFYTDWCPYCQTLDSDYLTAAPVQQYLKGVVKVRINPEHGPAEESIARQYGVTGYPAFFIVSTSAARPRKVHPFRRGGKNLTPAEFASACDQAASFSESRITSITNPPGTLIKNPGSANATRSPRKLKAQIVEVPPAKTPAVLPSVDTVLDKYVAAIGGRDTQKKITSRVSKGRIDVPGVSFGGKFEVYAKAPNKSLTITNVEPMGLVKEGFDGRNSWNSAQNGLDAASEVARAAIVDNDFYRDIKLKELYTSIKVLDKVKDGFRHFYLVEAVPASGSAERWYFDVDSGLLVRRDLTRTTAKGSVRAEVYYHDWRAVDGVKIPFRITQSMPAMKFVTTIEEVKHNVPVDDAIFRRP